jgi:hypothetical protein
MTNEQIIKQLEELIDDREAFCISDPEHDEIYIKDINALKAAIEFLKTGTRQGEWKISPNRYFPYCSVCETAIDPLAKNLTKYCPNCGARMDGDTK